MKVYVKVLKTREQTREQLLKDIIIEDLREKLEKATIDYQAVIAENKMLREQLNGSNNDSDIISFDEFEAIIKAKTREEELIDELGATKMMLSTLRKEYDMLQKQYDGLKKTHEETKEKDARAAFEMGQSHAELYMELQKKNKDYDNLQYKSEKLQRIYNELLERNSRIINHVDAYMSDNFYNAIVNFCELLRLLGIGDSRFKFENNEYTEEKGDKEQ